MKSTKVNKQRKNKNKNTRKLKGGSKLSPQDVNLNPIFRKYKLNQEERRVIFLKMNTFFEELLPNVDDDKYIDKYFREPNFGMLKKIDNFLGGISTIPQEKSKNLSEDLYNFLYDILMKKSKLFRSLSKSQTLSESVGSSTNDLSVSSILSNKDTITFRKISPSEVHEDTPLYTIE